MRSKLSKKCFERKKALKTQDSEMFCLQYTQHFKAKSPQTEQSQGVSEKLGHLLLCLDLESSFDRGRRLRLLVEWELQVKPSDT